MLSFLFNLQLKLKNTIDVGIFEELPFPSTDGEVNNQGSAKIEPELINKEGKSDDKVQEEDVGEGEGGDDKEDMSAESQVAQEKSGYKLKERKGEDQDDKEATNRLNDTLFFNVEPQRSALEDEEPRGHGQEGFKNTEVSIIIRSDLKDGDENRNQEEELQMSAVDKLSEQPEDTNVNNSFDVSIQSQDNLGQPDPTSSENENEEKEQLVMSTLAVPSIHFGTLPKRKELPATPEYKKTRKKMTQDKGLIAAKKESTEEVKIIIQPEDEHPGDDCNVDGDDDVDDGNDNDDDFLSAQDLLCFSWQIAQGMVSRQPKQGKF